MQKTGIKLTSSFTGNPLVIEKEEIKVVEGSTEHDSNSKVYTKTKGNFYVKEDPASISKAAFDNIVEL